MIFYDYEVFKYDWLVVIIDTDSKQEIVIINDAEQLLGFYNSHKNDVWVGFNSNGYDRYIHKGIISGFDPKEINDWIIVKRKKGWEFSNTLHEVQLFNYDVMTNRYHSLKQLEAFMGHDIRETTVPFNIDRKLTSDEIIEVIYYCKHDVYETIEVFTEQIKEFNSQVSLINEFTLPLSNISKTKAQLSAKILSAYHPSIPRNDEMDITIVDTLNINKYKEVLDFYQNNRDYKNKLTIDIAGVKHTFAWGGLHGARHNYMQEGFFINMDVASYYPALMIEYNFLSRNVKNPQKYKEIRDTRLKLKAQDDPREFPYKIVLNSTYGASKDKYNGLYDPLQANNVCVNGQLLLLDLIEKLEDYCEIVQSNTDGILVRLYDKSDFDLIDDIAHEWETRTRMELEFDIYSKVIQKDVNNYIFVDYTGDYKSKGAYVKKLSLLDNDLPVVNQAIVNYFVKNTSVEDTINDCDELIQFQKVVKISSKYEYAIYGKRKRSEKVFRLFASKRGKQLMKVKEGTPNKIAYTPDVCKIVNTDITNEKVPDWLDRLWYINLAKKRIQDFLGEEG